LVLVDLQGDAVGALAASLPAETLAIKADICDDAQVEAMIAEALERFGAIDVLINNAGIGKPRTVEQLDIETWRQTLEVNLTAPFRLTKALMPELTRRRGHIVTVASMAARILIPMLPHYSASKAGVAAFSETLRSELKPLGVGVTTVYFGTIDTPLLATGIADAAVGDRALKNMALARRLGASPLLSAETAGESIVRAIEKNRRRVIRPRRAAGVFHLPAPFQRVAERVRW
ncbi:MAG: SDR family oxidoreductase, partial [Solirubrobacterales bacterium]